MTGMPLFVLEMTKLPLINFKMTKMPLFPLSHLKMTEMKTDLATLTQYQEQSVARLNNLGAGSIQYLKAHRDLITDNNSITLGI